ncbi:MAG: hypothetical protein ACR2PF_09115 [Rhizobiaceae bacterium]
MTGRAPLTAVAAVSLLMAASPAHAYVSDGHEYTLSCNQDGYVLTSVNPVARTIGSGAGTEQVKGTEFINLGKSCDASHKLFGTGKWFWANGGVRAEFEGHVFGFPRQELLCEPEPAFSGNCNC